MSAVCSFSFHWNIKKNEWYELPDATMGHQSQKKTPSPPFVAANMVLLPKYLMQSDVYGQQVKDHRHHHHHHHKQWSIPNSFIHSSVHLSIYLSEESYADSLKYFIIVVVIEFILEIDLTKNNQIDSETTKTSPSPSPQVLV